MVKCTDPMKLTQPFNLHSFVIHWNNFWFIRARVIIFKSKQMSHTINNHHLSPFYCSRSILIFLCKISIFHCLRKVSMCFSAFIAVCVARCRELRWPQRSDSKRIPHKFLANEFLANAFLTHSANAFLTNSTVHTLSLEGVALAPNVFISSFESSADLYHRYCFTQYNPDSSAPELKVARKFPGNFQEMEIS